jgi:hypothetical protein
MGIRRLPLSPITFAFSLTETFEMIFDIPLIINNIAIAVIAGIIYVLALAYAFAILVFAI